MAKAFCHQFCQRLQSFNAFCLPGELFQHAATGAACAYNSITVLLGIFVYLQFDIFASTHTHTHRVAHLHTHTVAKKRCPRCLNKGRAALSCIRSHSLSISLSLLLLISRSSRYCCCCCLTRISIFNLAFRFDFPTDTRRTLKRSVAFAALRPKA